MIMGITHFIQNDNMASTLIRASTPLTTTFVSCSAFNVQGANNLGLYFGFTKGLSSGLVCQIQTSLDNTNYYPELEQEQTGTGTTLYRLNYRTMQVATTSVTKWKWDKTLRNNERWVKVFVKALTKATNAAVKITAVKSVVG
jgi:hypothetical protein